MKLPATARAAIFTLLAVVAASGLGLWLSRSGRSGTSVPTAMAVEFTSHAAAAYVAQERGWYRAQGLNLTSHSSYVTGMALAAALARRDVQVAYLCLVPAINAYANARVPIRIVAGTHKHGYGLVVNPARVTTVEDLSRDGVRLGCVREGGAVDVLLNRTIERYRLDRKRILGRVRRMNPPRLLFAIRAGQLDAAFLPEQWASMAEDHGFSMLLTAQDVWPGMQGSVLVVKQELIRDDPHLVRKLVAVNRDATRWINDHPREAASTLARALSVSGEEIVAADMPRLESRLGLTPETMLRSMRRMEYSTEISVRDVQAVIDYLARLGYIKGSFPAGDLVDASFAR